MRRYGQIAIAAGFALVGASAASAQVAGIPYYVNPRGGTGFSVAANVGSTNNNGGNAWALTGGLGMGPGYLTASVGSTNPKGPTPAVSTYGGTFGLKLFGGGLMPLSVGVQAGVGMFKRNGVTTTTIPVALGVGLSVPLFPLKPWIAPRVEFDRTSGGGSPSTNTTRVGVSAGADFNLLLGLGFHAAVDYLPKKTGTTPLPSSTTIGVGAHFNFRVPMM